MLQRRTQAADSAAIDKLNREDIEATLPALCVCKGYFDADGRCLEGYATTATTPTAVPTLSMSETSSLTRTCNIGRRDAA